MSPEWTNLATWGSFLWALSTVGILAIQLLAWPDDRQMWSAVVTVAATSVFLWRLWIALAFGLTMKDNPSALLFVTTTIAWGWYGYESWQMNVGRYRHRLRNWRQHPAVALIAQWRDRRGR